MTTEEYIPLSESEIIQLDDFLLSLDESNEHLTIDEAHGFVTALTVAGSAHREHWMQSVWGNPAFSDEEEQAQLTDLMQRMVQEIEVVLEQGRNYEPMVAEFEEEGEDIISYEGWCYGFMLGVSLDQDKWESLPKHEQEMLGPIARIALLGEDESPDLDDEEYEMLVELIPGAVVSLYQYWHN